MNATITIPQADTTATGFPPVPPEAHQQAGVLTGPGYTFMVDSIEATPLMMRDGLIFRIATPDEILDVARRIMAARVNAGPLMTSPQTVKDYVRITYGGLPHEVFAVLFLDSQNRLIAVDEMFRGSLNQTSVYPREVVKAALAHNANAVLFIHNHPSDSPEPSRADELLTQTLKSALALVDVRVLDHLIATRTEVTSFAERGLI